MKLSTIRARVRKLRVLSGLSARELAGIAGVAHSLVSYLEEGTRVDPRSSTVTALAATCGVSLDWLVLGEGDEPTAESVHAAVEAARAVRAVA